MKPEILPFNTAVFYDIENLLRGYRFSRQFVADLSLKDILADITATKLVGRTAVQRAYANWSDPRLGVLRNEINELGIAPVQIFGFSRDARKNAADIQLAIDAIDLAHSRPAIDTFVVVSGDGGFAALAKKLHEYGRSVIGCAYRNATNQTFHAVCDAFVWIEPPDQAEEEDPRQGERVVQGQSSPQGSGQPISGVALQGEVIEKVGRLRPGRNRSQIETSIHKLLETMGSAPSFRRQMRGEGVPLTVYGQVLRECIPDFDPAELGFPKLTELMRRCCTGTPWQVGRRLSDGALCVVLRLEAGKDAMGLQPLEDLHEAELHGESFYRILLRQGQPTLRLSSPIEFQTIVGHLCSSPPKAVGLGEAIEICADFFQGSISSDSVKQTLLTLVSAGIFDRTPAEAPLGEQQLALREDYTDPRIIIERVRSLAQEKIRKLMGRIDEETLAKIV